MRRPGSPILVAALMLLLSGCGHRVRVVDAHGHPLPGAAVRAVYPSFDGDEVRTDESGQARIPECLVGEPRWLCLRCHGYAERWIDWPRSFPVTVVMHPVSKAD